MKELLLQFIALSRDCFGQNLVGVYLHGSAAMGCYHPQKSDLDLIVVVQDPPTDDIKRKFMDGVVAVHEKTPGKGIEMSVVTRDVCDPFVYPTPFQLHFSGGHLDWYRRDPDDYIQNMRGTDKDLAAHCTVLRARGQCLYGPPIEEVFGEVSAADYIDSLWYDVGGAATEILEDPMYLTLNLARVLTYLEDGSVLSKEEGGHWALHHLPKNYHPLLEAALEEYTEGKNVSYDPDLALAYANDMLIRIRSAIQ